MSMKLKYLFLVLITIFIPIKSASADTYIDSNTALQSTDWYIDNGPYVIKGEVTVPDGVVLHIHEGVILNFINAHVYVKGKIFFDGKSGNPVQLNQDEESTGLTIDRGELTLNHVDALGGKSLIDTENNSIVHISNSSIKDIKGYDTAFRVTSSSSLSFDSTDLTNIDVPIGIHIYDDGKVYIKNSSFTNAGNIVSIKVHEQKTSGSTVVVRDSSFKDSVAGFEIYNQASVSIDNSAVEGMLDVGIRMYASSTLNVTRTTVSSNNIGIQSVDSFLSLIDSKIEYNKTYGIYRIAGTFVDQNNIYDPNQQNLYLPKKIIFLEGDTKKKPKATSTLCCSNILFLPGIEASRLYKKQFTGENQLWEPNINGDVDKLYLNSLGVPNNKNIYTRDYIDTTNIGAGIFDKEIYQGFTDFLNNMQGSGAITKWEGYPYDWRKSPSDIATQNQDLDGGFTSLEAKLEELASSSRSRKVTIIGHSYGGIIAKYFLKHLHDIGKDNLVESLILIAVPESGTSESIGAMLHGDDQEIAGGYMLNAETARGLSQNMQSAYYLLPDSNLITYLGGQIIKYDGSSWFDTYSGFKLSNEQELYDFLTNEKKNRPYAKSLSDTRLPLKVNKYLLDKMLKTKQESGLDDVYKTMPINIYNIVGTGLDTVQSYIYMKEECEGSLTAIIQRYVDKYCGFTHDVNYTNKGDGTVLAGDMSKRWGTTYIFNVSKYNDKYQTNLAHADITSSQSIQQMIDLIIKRDSLSVLPDYISQYVSDTSEDDGGYEYTIDDALEMEAEDTIGNTAGYIPKVTSKKIKLIKNTIPNSRYKRIGNTNKLITKKSVKKIKLISKVVTSKPKTVKFFTLKSKKLKNSTQEKEDEFIFKEVPVTSESKIEVELLPASTSPAVIHIDLYGDGSIVDIPPSYPKATTTQESIDIHKLIMETIKQVQDSSVRLAFKNRYILRLNNIDKWFLKDKISFSYLLSARESNSLYLIAKELYKSKPRYYRGGMNTGDTLFLQPKFEKITNALKIMI